MNAHRIWEIDFLRGTAIILMVVFHIIYDLAEFYGHPLEYAGGVWFFTGRSSAVLFIILSGVSSNFSAHLFRRSCRVLAAAMLVSAVTYFFDPLLYVRFGILHLLGVCMSVSIIFHKLKPKTAIMSAALAAVAVFALWVMFADRPPVAATWLFIPLGITPPDFRSMDYYPLFPWSGLFFGGLALGKLLYAEKKSLGASSLSSLSPVKSLCFLGRHSLTIYLLHQPVIMPILFFIHQF